MPNMDDLIYVKYISDSIGYGAFAKKFIKAGEMIGEITGIVGEMQPAA
jgi:hypothetical protein